MAILCRTEIAQLQSAAEEVRHLVFATSVEVFCLLALTLGCLGLLNWLNRRKLAKFVEIAQRLNGSTWSKGIWSFGDLQASASGTSHGRKVEISYREGSHVKPRTRIEVAYKNWADVRQLSDAQISETNHRLEVLIPSQLAAIGGQFYLNKNLAGWTAPMLLPELEITIDLLSHLDFRAVELEKVARPSLRDTP